MKEAFKPNGDTYLALLALRASPGKQNSDSNTLPAALYCSILIWTILPSINTNIDLINKKTYKKSNSNEYNFTNLPQLKKNDKIRLHDGQIWKTKREIVEQLFEPPRSYLTRTENGSAICCNREHVLFRKSGNSDSGFWKETVDDEFLFNTYNKTNNTTDQTPGYLCKKTVETTNVTRTFSGRIVRRSSIHDDYVTK